MSKQTTQKPGILGKLDYYGAALIAQTRLKYLLANAFGALLPSFVGGVIRGRLYRLAGFNIAPGSFIMGNLHLTSGQKNFYEMLTLGENVVVGDHVTINLDAKVTVGKNVAFGPRVIIYTASHQLGFGSMRRMPDIVAKPVTIEDGCWIGLAAIILPGVTIGHGSVIAAGSVVMESVPPDSYVEGNPAKPVRKLPWGNR
jgi:acetyltransferase-like isoleucine patch superfamily enzyme